MDASESEVPQWLHAAAQLSGLRGVGREERENRKIGNEKEEENDCVREAEKRAHSCREKRG